MVTLVLMDVGINKFESQQWGIHVQFWAVLKFVLKNDFVVVGVIKIAISDEVHNKTTSSDIPIFADSIRARRKRPSLILN